MLRIKNIKKIFNRFSELENVIFNGFNLEIEENSSVAIIGSNGCGKSTLLNLIAGSLELDGGEISIDNKEISNLSEKSRSQFFGRVHQNPSLGVSPSLTILENMSLADNKNKKFGLKKLVDKKDIERYKEILSSLNLGLENKLHTKVSLLSGGQRQSLSMLMATMNNPKVLLLDEHTAALDPKTSKLIMEKTKQLLETKQMTTVMITHNMRDAVNYADRVVMLKEGEVVFDEMTSDISESDLERLYIQTSM